MNQIFIYNGEPRFLKEGFPEKPSGNEDDYKSSVVDGKWVSMVDAKSMAEYIYKRKLQSSIDKALRFEDSQEHKLLFLNAIPEAGVVGINKPANLIGFNFKDGAYKLPDAWRVVEQWQYQALSDTWNNFQSDVFDIENMNKQGFTTRLIARLVPIEKQEKKATELNPFSDEVLDYFDTLKRVNTTASDKTPSPVKTAEEILSTVNNAEWTGEGEPLFSYDQVIEVMNVYASQFRGQMTTK